MEADLEVEEEEIEVEGEGVSAEAEVLAAVEVLAGEEGEGGSRGMRAHQIKL